MTLTNRHRHNDGGNILRFWIVSAAVCLLPYSS